MILWAALAPWRECDLSFGSGLLVRSLFPDLLTTTMQILNDNQAELICGGKLNLAFINVVNNDIAVDAGDVMVSPQVRVAAATQLNNGINVSAFGGYNSSYRADLSTAQFNGLVLA